MKTHRRDKAQGGDPEAVKRLLDGGRWADDAGVTHDGPWAVRWREPLLSHRDVGAYIHCLQIVWTFAPEGSRHALSRDDEAKLVVFEAALRASLEHDALAVLTAILTFEGARQWILYTRDVAACVGRIDALPHTGEPRPIERDAFEDPTWEYLRDEVLGGVRGGDE